MTLASALINYKRVGPGNLFLAPAPQADPGTGTQQSTEEGYYSLFYADGAAKKVLKGGVKPYGTSEKVGFNLKIKPSKATADPCNGPKTDFITGIDTATGDTTIFEAWDPAHLVDMYGSQASDLILQVAAVGKAARTIALIGPQSYNTPYVAMWRMASPVVPGEFWHYLLPNVILEPDLDLTAGKDKVMTTKISFQMQCSPFLFNSAGFGVVLITDDPTAPGL